MMGPSAVKCVLSVYQKLKRTRTVKVLILLGIVGVPKRIRTPAIAVKEEKNLDLLPGFPFYFHNQEVVAVLLTLSILLFCPF